MTILRERVLYERAGVQVLSVPRPKLIGKGVSYRYHLVVDGERRRDMRTWQACKVLAEYISNRRLN